MTEIKELIEFSEIWFNDVEEGEPIAQDEIDLVKDLITALKSQLAITELAENGFKEVQIATKFLQHVPPMGMLYDLAEINLKAIRRKNDECS